MTNEVLRRISPQDVDDAFILHDGTIVTPMQQGGWTIVERAGLDGQRIKWQQVPTYATTNFVKGVREEVVFVAG